MSDLESIARGLKAAGKSLFTKREEFSAAGRPIICTHCGGSKFEKKNGKLTTDLRSGFMADDASALVCKNCSKIEWFFGNI